MKLRNALCGLLMAATIPGVVTTSRGEVPEERPRVSLNITRAYPRLEEVNTALRESGKNFGVSDVETWDDVYTGSIGIQFDNVEALMNRSLKPNITFGVYFASGEVETDKRFSLPGVDTGDFFLKLHYKTWFIESGMDYELWRSSSNSYEVMATAGITWTDLESHLRGSAHFDNLQQFNIDIDQKNRSNGFGWYAGLLGTMKIKESWRLVARAQYKDSELGGQDEMGQYLPVDFSGYAISLGIQKTF